MTTVPSENHQDELIALRRDLHAHPELAFEEKRTSDIVAHLLEKWGYHVHRGLGGTGVVGTLANGSGQRTIGLRADMDALPIQETTGAAHASRSPGKMHACGHDGHMTMLLGAPSRGNQALRRRRACHLSARGGRYRRGAAHDRAGVVRALPVRCGVRHA